MSTQERPPADELLERKRQLEPLLDISPSAIIITDGESHVVAWNPAAEELFGYTADEAIGRNLDDLVAKTEELHRAAVDYSQQALGKREIRAVTRRTRKDGTLVDVELRVAPLLADGETIGTFGVYHDITELTRQHRFLEALLETSPEAIVTITPDDVVSSWNPAAEKLFGFTAGEAVGQNIDDLVSRGELQAEGKELSRSAVEHPTAHMVTQRTRRDGSLVDVDIVGAGIRLGGELVGKHVFYQDISEIQRQRRYHEALLELSPAAIVTVDPEGRVTSWNPAAEELFGYTASEAMGRDLDDLVARSEEIREEGRRITREGLSGKKTRVITRRNRKDGTLVDVELTGARVTVGGEHVADMVIYHDISEIQRQRRYYESLLETSPTAIMTVDMTATVTSWNPAAEHLLGYSREEALGRNIDDLVANSDEIRAEAEEVSRQASEGGRVHLVTRRTRKDGSLVDVDVVAAPILIGGATVGYYAMYSDISEIQRQRQFYESLVEVSPVAVCLLEADGTVTSWNPAAERLFGYTAEEAIGRNIDDLVATSEAVRAEALAYTVQARRGGGVHAITRRNRKDGSLVDVELLGVPVIIAGEQFGYYTLYHDVSEIQRQKRYYEALFQSNPVAIALVDFEGTVTSWNPTAVELFGYSAEEAIGRNIDDLVATSDEVRAEAVALTKGGTQGELHRVVTRRTRKDGTFVDVEMFGAPVVVSDEAAGFYAMYHDIGELQQARREAEAATQAKSAFLATMSHEIRTPLNAVIGMTGLLLDTELTSEQRGFGEVIRQSGDALLAVINEILDFSKIEAGRLDLERQPFRLRECVESALDLVATAAADKSLDLAYLIEPLSPAAIVGDFTRLRQILLNLLNNAVKFTERGEVVLKVDARAIELPSDGEPRTYEIHFSVRDTGIGIPQDRIDALFQAFTQVDASTTRRYGGTGLGLAISKRLAEEMGGRMWVESSVGKGSTFHVTIRAAASTLTVLDDLVSIPELGGKRVLIVDDNATNREILRRQVLSWGMVPRELASPLEALAAVRGGESFDVAILDMQMPEMDGVTLAREIHRLRDPARPPLVMLTSLGRRETPPAGVEFAASLTKPIRPSQLYDALVGIFGVTAAPQRVRRPERPEAAPAEDRPPLRILLAEDNAVNQKVALLLLEKLGYRADVASDGREAVQAVERQSYDVVLMDVRMPEMDGLEATRMILERLPGPDRPRIVAMTAGATEADRDECIEAGMDDYVSKPIRREELAAALARAAPVRGPDGPAVDAAALDTLREEVGGGEALEDLTKTFLEDTDRTLVALREDVRARHVDEVGRLAHSLKSTAASFGAGRLSELCRSLEDLARGGGLDDAARWIEDIAAEFARVREVLEPGASTG